MKRFKRLLIALAVLLAATTSLTGCGIFGATESAVDEFLNIDFDQFYE